MIIDLSTSRAAPETMGPSLETLIDRAIAGASDLLMRWVGHSDLTLNDAALEAASHQIPHTQLGIYALFASTPKLLAAAPGNWSGDPLAAITGLILDAIVEGVVKDLENQQQYQVFSPMYSQYSCFAD